MKTRFPFPRLGRTQKIVVEIVEKEGGATNIWTVCRRSGDTRAGFIPMAVYRLVRRGVLVEVRPGDNVSELSDRQRRALHKAIEKHPRAFHFFVLAEPFIQYVVD